MRVVYTPVACRLARATPVDSRLRDVESRPHAHFSALRGGRRRVAANGMVKIPYAKELVTFPQVKEWRRIMSAMSINKLLLALLAFMFVCWLELAGNDREIAEGSTRG